MVIDLIKQVTNWCSICAEYGPATSGYVPPDLDATIVAGKEEYNWSKACEQRYIDYPKLDMDMSFKINTENWIGSR